MGRKLLVAAVFGALIAGATAGAALAGAGPIEQCAGGSCAARQCRACCPEGKSPSCSWWACKCQTDTLAAASLGVGSIIDP